MTPGQKLICVKYFFKRSAKPKNVKSKRRLHISNAVEASLANINTPWNILC